MKNLLIRQQAQKKGVRMWEIAAFLGMHASTFSNKLRFELSDEMREKVINAIDSIANEKGTLAAGTN